MTLNWEECKENNLTSLARKQKSSLPTVRYCGLNVYVLPDLHIEILTTMVTVDIGRESN
jgi:hypothetical protein